ncbi:hypothetical protein WH96_14720 [Kiloniella spongiae]|uniref:Uncharacterized protein n=1 Tax=Kiloniella spongiae TaxID=1489064 RepID=A0A0H2MCA4_9PROT|nr:hypothetical protein [Kiloniella spongiae]KLN59963.1 hypothetical protein WH96_14720 [Kiloniella spongiae]
MPTTRQEVHVPHGIDSISKIIKFEAYLTDNITTLQSTHTAIGNNEEDYAIASWVNTTHVVISPGRDQSHLTSGHAIIEYTK